MNRSSSSSCYAMLTYKKKKNDRNNFQLMKTTRPWGLPRQTLDLFLVREKKVARTPYEIYERFDISPSEYRADGKLYPMSNKIAETIYIRGTTGWINGLVYRFSDRWVGTVSFAFNPRKRSSRATTLYADHPCSFIGFSLKTMPLRSRRPAPRWM